MIGLLLWALGLIGQWCLGIVLAQVVLGSRRVAPGESTSINAETAGLGLLLGIGGTAWLLFLWSLLGGHLGRIPSLIVTGAGLICGLLLAWRAIRGRRSTTSSGEKPDDGARADHSLSRVCRGFVVVMSLLAIAQTLLTPQRFWDERATFGLRALVLFEDASVWSSDLRHPDFVIAHPRYPLLIPMAEQHLYALLGSADDRWSKIVFPLLYLGMCLCFAGVLSRSRASGQAWLWALVLATVPALMPHQYGFLCGQADAPMGCFHGMSILYLWDFWQGRKTSLGTSLPPWRSALAAGILAAFAAFTKDEGIAFLVIDVALSIGLAILVLGIFRSSPLAARSQPLWVGILFLGVALTLLAPWFIYRRSLPMTTEMNYFGRLTSLTFSDHVAHIDWLIRHFWGRMFQDVREWGWQWWWLPAGILLAPRRLFCFSQGLLLGDIAAALLALLVAGLLAPVEMTEHIGGSSDRFLMQIAPLAILFAAGQLSSVSAQDRSIVP